MAKGGTSEQSPLDAMSNMVGNAYRDAVPSSYRLYLRGMTGDQTPVDQSYFSPSDLSGLQKLVSSVESRRAQDSSHANDTSHEVLKSDGMGGMDRYMESGPPTPTPMAVTRTTYGDPGNSGSSEMTNAMRSLGSFRYNFDPNGNAVVKDRYDFNQRDGGAKDGSVLSYLLKSLQTGSVEPLAFRVGRMFAPAENGGGFDMNLNLGNPASWPKK